MRNGVYLVLAVGYISFAICYFSRAHYGADFEVAVLLGIAFLLVK